MSSLVVSRLQTDPRHRLRAHVATFVSARQMTTALRFAAAGTTVGGLVAALVALAAQIFDVALSPAVAALLVVGPALGGAVGGWLRRAPLGRVALEIDRQLGLDERVTTALELAEIGLTGRSVSSPGRTRTRPREGERTTGLAFLRAHPSTAIASARSDLAAALAEDQIADAVARLDEARPSAVYPWQVPRGLLVAIGVSLILAVAPWFVAIPSLLGNQFPAGRVAKVSQVEADRLEVVARRIENEASSGPEGASAANRAQIAAQLRQAAAELRQSRASSQEATRDLQQAEASTEALAPATGEDASVTLARIADALNSQSLTQPTTQALDQQDPARAAANLRQLAANVAAMSADQREQLAQALQAAASAARGSETQAAQELQQAADAARRGDQAGVAQAAQALEQLSAASQNQRAVAEARSELQSSREAISRASQGGTPDRPGDVGQADGRDSSGASESSAASGAGPGDPAANQGGSSDNGPTAAQGDQATNQNGAGVGTGEAEHQGTPHDLQSLAQREVTVPTNGNGDPVSVSASNQTQVGASGTSQVDYVNVLPQYRDQALQAIDGNVVPTGLKQVVKGYFDSLAPK